MKNCSFFVFSVDDSKYPVTVWAKYLSASERSHLILLENAVVQPLKIQDFGILC